MTANMVLYKIGSIVPTPQNRVFKSIFTDIIEEIYPYGTEERAAISMLASTIIQEPTSVVRSALEAFFEHATTYDLAALIVFLFARANMYADTYKKIANIVHNLQLHRSMKYAIVTILREKAEEFDTDFPSLRMAIAKCFLLYLSLEH